MNLGSHRRFGASQQNPDSGNLISEIQIPSVSPFYLLLYARTCFEGNPKEGLTLLSQKLEHTKDAEGFKNIERILLTGAGVLRVANNFGAPVPGF